MDLRSAMKLYLDSRRGLVSTVTLRGYTEALTYLATFLGNRSLAEITIEDLRGFRAFLFGKTTRWGVQRPQIEGGLSRYTIHSKLRIIRQFFRFLMEEGYIRGDPALRLELPSLPDEPPKAILDSDIEKLLQAARGEPREYALLLFISTTGARVGGVVGLKLADLNLPAATAIVREKGRGGAKTRTVFLTQETVRALKAWLVVREAEQFFVRHKTDRVFTGKRGALTGRGVYAMIERLAEKADVQGRFNPHSFRHAFARDLLNNGADLGSVSQLLGHSSIVVTAKHYARWATEELHEKHGRFAPRHGAKRRKT